MRQAEPEDTRIDWEGAMLASATASMSRPSEPTSTGRVTAWAAHAPQAARTCASGRWAAVWNCAIGI